MMMPNQFHSVSWYPNEHDHFFSYRNKLDLSKIDPEKNNIEPIAVKEISYVTCFDVYKFCKEVPIIIYGTSNGNVAIMNLKNLNEVYLFITK
jgi:hypothetical protein